MEMKRLRSLEADKRQFTLDLEMYEHNPRRFDYDYGLRAFPQDQKSIHWWRAQCSLRGIDFDSRDCIPSLKYRLNERGDSHDEIHGCPILLQGPDDAVWNQIKTPEEKAGADLRRLAFEAFEKEQVVEVRVNDYRRWKIRGFCERYGWWYEARTILEGSIWANSPEGEDDYAGWVVFGPIREEVKSRMRDIVKAHGHSLDPETPLSTGKRKRVDSAGPAGSGEQSRSRSVRRTLKFEGISQSPIPMIKLEGTSMPVKRL